MLRRTRKRISKVREASLMLAMFFLPLGYDWAFKLLMDLSGSYWIADITFYLISGFFWVLYIFCTRWLKNN